MIFQSQPKEEKKITQQQDTIMIMMTMRIVRFRISIITLMFVLWCCCPQAYIVSSLTMKSPSLLLSSTLTRINGDNTATTTIQSTTNDNYDDNVGGDVIGTWPSAAGATALRQVQFLASKVSESTDAMDESKFSLAMRRQNRMQSSNLGGKNNSMTKRRQRIEREKAKKERNSLDPVGEGGGVFNSEKYNEVAKKADKAKLKRSDLEVSSSDRREEQVWTALANLELDSKLLLMMMLLRE
jgi:hypothetical protein